MDKDIRQREDSHDSSRDNPSHAHDPTAHQDVSRPASSPPNVVDDEESRPVYSPLDIVDDEESRPVNSLQNAADESMSP